MPRQILKASLILLVLTGFAIVWHNIPSRSEISGLGSQVSGLSPEQKFLLSGPIDINEATIDELEAVPRIGPSMAKKIVEFRDQHSPIQNLEQLLEIKGVGPRILESIKPYLMCESKGFQQGL